MVEVYTAAACSTHRIHRKLQASREREEHDSLFVSLIHVPAPPLHAGYLVYVQYPASYHHGQQFISAFLVFWLDNAFHPTTGAVLELALASRLHVPFTAPNTRKGPWYAISFPREHLGPRQGTACTVVLMTAVCIRT